MQRVLMKRLRILLAENSRSIAVHLRAILSSEFEVSGVVEDGQSLVLVADAFIPDVVITDIAMPGMDGLQAAENILGTHPGMGMVFITVHNDQRMVDKAMRLGRCGYVLKSDAGEDLLTAVKQVAQGKAFVSRSLDYQPTQRAGIDLKEKP